MAVVLVIIGLVILTVFPALTAARTGSQRMLTQNNLQALMLATAAYVQANGCLPCPTPPAVFGNGFGIVRGDATVNPNACGACPTPEGIPPYMSLGVPASTAHDGWGQWISMRVDPALTAAFNVVPPTKPVAPAHVRCQRMAPAHLRHRVAPVRRRSIMCARRCRPGLVHKVYALPDFQPRGA